MFAARNTLFTGLNLSLVTYTFPSGTSTWTAPPNTTLLVSAIGKGADGTSDTSGSATKIYTFLAISDYFGPYSNPPYADWSTIYGYATSLLGSINSGAPATRSPSIYWQSVSLNITTTSYYLGPYAVNEPLAGDAQTISGTFSLTNYRSAPTSGNITYAFVNGGSGSVNSAGWTITMPYDYTTYGSAGAATTGFGKTFPGGAYSGGTGYPATNTSFTNVAVTPGTTYTIVNNGSLTIQYYA